MTVDPTNETARPAPARDGDDADGDDTRVIGLAQLVLAEKRTSLAVMRTGVAVGLVPVSITTVLVTLSRYYEWIDNLHFLLPLYVVLSCLTLVSLYLIARSLRRLRRHDALLERMRQDHPGLARFLR